MPFTALELHRMAAEELYGIPPEDPRRYDPNVLGENNQPIDMALREQNQREAIARGLLYQKNPLDLSMHSDELNGIAYRGRVTLDAVKTQLRRARDNMMLMRDLSAEELYGISLEDPRRDVHSLDGVNTTPDIVVMEQTRREAIAEQALRRIDPFDLYYQLNSTTEHPQITQQALITPEAMRTVTQRVRTSLAQEGEQNARQTLSALRQEELDGITEDDWADNSYAISAFLTEEKYGSLVEEEKHRRVVKKEFEQMPLAKLKQFSVHDLRQMVKKTGVPKEMARALQDVFRKLLEEERSRKERQMKGAQTKVLSPLETIAELDQKMTDEALQHMSKRFQITIEDAKQAVQNERERRAGLKLWELVGPITTITSLDVLHALTKEEEENRATEVGMTPNDMRGVIRRELRAGAGVLRNRRYEEEFSGQRQVNLTPEEYELSDAVVTDASKAKPFLEAIAQWFPGYDKETWERIAEHPLRNCFSRALGRLDTTEDYLLGGPAGRKRFEGKIEKMLKDMQEDWRSNSKPADKLATHILSVSAEALATCADNVAEGLQMFTRIHRNYQKKKLKDYAPELIELYREDFRQHHFDNIHSLAVPVVLASDDESVELMQAIQVEVGKKEFGMKDVPEAMAYESTSGLTNWLKQDSIAIVRGLEDNGNNEELKKLAVDKYEALRQAAKEAKLDNGETWTFEDDMREYAKTEAEYISEQDVWREHVKEYYPDLLAEMIELKKEEQDERVKECENKMDAIDDYSSPEYAEATKKYSAAVKSQEQNKLAWVAIAERILLAKKLIENSGFNKAENPSRLDYKGYRLELLGNKKTNSFNYQIKGETDGVALLEVVTGDKRPDSKNIYIAADANLIRELNKAFDNAKEFNMKKENGKWASVAKGVVQKTQEAGRGVQK